MSEYICPHCKNPIYDDDALLCHFCGESLRRAGDGVFGKMKYAWSSRAIIITALIVVFLLVLLRIWG
jgi:predicted amidophosphoribosyltransferase